MKRVDWIKLLGLIILVLFVNYSAKAQVNAFSGALIDSSVDAQEDTSVGEGLYDSTPSLRNNSAVKMKENKRSTPLAYQYIRPKDAVWGKRVWEEIDTRMKMNAPFVYAGHGAEGNSLMLINILIKAIVSGEVTAFKGVDDRFTAPMTAEEVKNELTGKADTIMVPDPVTGDMIQKVIRNDFNPESVKTYRLKEDWIFDRETSQLYCRIIGIATLQNIVDPETGELRGKMPLFWVYYPDLRPILAKYDVYNPNNFYQHISWADLFDMRRFSGHIVKEDNVYGETIKQQIPGDSTDAGIKRLLKGRDIHNKIFNFEQSLWAY